MTIVAAGIIVFKLSLVVENLVCRSVPGFLGYEVKD